MWIGVLAFAAGSLVINEILYDPPGADGGSEFVELYNADTTSVVWSSLRLEVGDGAQPGRWRAVWEQATGALEPGGLLLIGGDSVEPATQSLTGSLQNGPDAVRLLQDDIVVDLVGYGSLTDARLFETSPAVDVTAQSLARIPDGADTDNNGIDLQAHDPTAGRRNRPQREWQLQVLEPPWHRFWPGRRLAVQASLHNVGSATTMAPDWQLEASLSRLPEPGAFGHRPDAAARKLSLNGVPAALAAGDSALLEVRWTGESGVFLLTLQSNGQDEWVADNRAELVGRVGSGPVIVNEIHYAPLSDQPEWVELWNRSMHDKDLNGWTLRDASGRTAVLQATSVLAADSFAVVRESVERTVPGQSPGALPVGARPWPSLNNTDDELGVADILELRDAEGLLQDAVFYSGRHTVRGRSLERVHADADVRGVLWSLSKNPQGSTPGRVNSVAGGVAMLGSVSLEPNPISPDGDGRNDVLHIRLQVPDGHDGFHARLFDMAGRLRRDLAGDRLGAGPRTLLWDATDDSGATVELGVYLLHLEFFGKQGSAARLIRTVGVVRP